MRPELGKGLVEPALEPVRKSTSELAYLSILRETFVNLHAIEQMQFGEDVASMAWNLYYAIERTQLRGCCRVDGVESPHYRADAVT